MKISFENANTYVDRTGVYDKTQTNNKITGQQAYNADISGIVMDNEAYTVHGRTMRDVMQDAQNIDVKAQTDYLTVMSHSMSGEDFGKMLEEGVDPASCDAHTTVTIMDKIKAELAKSGVAVEGFTDDIDPETLKEIAGSEAYANHLANSMKSADVPVTKENLKEADEAVKKAMELTPLSEGELKYLVLNDLGPSIENIYFANHSGAVDADRQSRGYFMEGNGYYAKKADGADLASLGTQVEEILAEAGIETSEENIEKATWLIEKGIPLTDRTFKTLDKNKSVGLPVSEEQAVKAVVTAMSDSIPAMRADLTNTETKYEKAARLEKRVEALLNDSTISVHDKRVLEETRLKMTAEVNVKLIESGFSIDTSDLEELVEALKEAEISVAKRYFPEEEGDVAVANKALLDETVAKRNSLYEMPASTLGSLIFTRHESVSVESLYDEGLRQKNAFEAARESYETLMTAPRRDLGDSIKKAFANVDDILEDLNMDLSDRNRRGVRILAYNRVEITEENIEKMVEADRRVNRVVERMTPAAALKMIRDGVNPLKTSFEELENYLKNENEDTEKQMETYSRYLYRLEQNGEISDDERTAYIGIFRMLRQIEKSDGAVIGRVLEAGRELNFSNLLSAARIAKKSGMDILVDDNFGGLKDLVYSDTPIDVQVSAGDSGNSFLYKQTFEELKEITAETINDKEITELLEKSDLSPTLPHIKEAVEGKNNSSKSWNRVNKFVGKEKLDDFAMNILDAFTGRDEAVEAYEKAAEEIKTSLTEDMFNPSLKALDIRDMKSSHIFMSVAVGMAREEIYEIPVTGVDGESSIRLTIRHDSENKGNALITLPTEDMGDVSVSLRLEGNEASAFIISSKDNKEKRETLQNMLNIAFEKDDITFRNL
ncbi:MAG: hypothetical protein J6U15_00630, partial [Lachnospiraceae bacterium]|nr:hypothetical protein [Lachnospiraceae bacterium]